MKSLLKYFSPKILFKTHSLINGDIEVSEFRGKRELIIGGLQQSGELVAQLWREGIKPVVSSRLSVGRILLLGVGGGSAIPVLLKHFQKAHITAVEIDPVIVDIGKKYFELKESKYLSIVVDDAYEFVKQEGKYDLVIVDIYSGSIIPAKVKSKGFLASIQKIAPRGIMVFNHIRSHPREERAADKFEKKLREVFSKVLYSDVLVNRLFICSYL